ncbi:MAG: ABC transporter ATP-binding protein [Proteobacteria bacterium]|uniref:ATP-binding cassette domain-containing protein n=1 Tax=Hyphomicrobiales TaxID=356 RepID=UPI000370039C|nr:MULTISPECIES: ABC transporter ATP-binding protein [Phyllobacteriaceae]MCA0276953.1 ABC transporter ATP-binding protein [Pseudomonadota bacterium]MCX8572272.1 ABC transporter ATP-binding protein [Aminobacter sp. MET-1]
MTMLDVRDVSFGYDRQRKVLHGVSFVVKKGVSVGLVGESGSGKTTLLRLLLGLARPTGGTINFGDAVVDPSSRTFMRGYRRSVQAVFQDPYSSLDPRQKVRDIISEPLQSLAIPGSHSEAVAASLEAVGLPADAVNRYPHEFSGGQRQRIAIARAIVSRPQLVLADEAVSALDLSTRIRIVDLFKRLSESMTLVFVSHDLGVVASLCEEIIILERGQIVESGNTRAILDAPQHPYTQKLLQSVPRMPS